MCFFILQVMLRSFLSQIKVCVLELLAHNHIFFNFCKDFELYRRSRETAQKQPVCLWRKKKVLTNENGCFFQGVYPVYFPSVFHHKVCIIEIHCHCWVSFVLVLSCAFFSLWFLRFCLIVEYLMYSQEWTQKKCYLFLFWSWLYALVGKPSITFYANRMLIGYCESSKYQFFSAWFIFAYHFKERLYFIRDLSFFLMNKIP